MTDAHVTELHARRCPIEVSQDILAEEPGHPVTRLLISEPDRDTINYYAVTATGFHIWGTASVHSEAEFDPECDPRSEWYGGEPPEVVFIVDPFGVTPPAQYMLVDRAAFDPTGDPDSVEDIEMHIDYICIDALTSTLKRHAKANNWKVPDSE